jgi:hypothetical protein
MVVDYGLPEATDYFSLSDIAGAHRAGIAGEDRQSSFTQAPPALEANVRDLGRLFDSAAAPVRWSRSAARNTNGGEL